MHSWADFGAGWGLGVADGMAWALQVGGTSGGGRREVAAGMERADVLHHAQGLHIDRTGASETQHACQAARHECAALPVA